MTTDNARPNANAEVTPIWPTFGDAPVAWEPISWTDDLQTAIKWREESHLYWRKDFKRIPKHPKLSPLE